MSATLEMPAARRTAQHRPAKSSAGWILLLVNCLAIAALAIWLRCWKLGNIPGMNGDEAWYGVQAMALVRGDEIAWRTPTGNLVNPFFLVPQIFLHACFGPSFGLLRSVAVASGLAALGLNLYLCGRVFGRRTAVVSTLLLAVLPMNIAYSRFAWDASQSLAATVLALYLPFLAVCEPKQRWWWTLLGVGMVPAAVIVHPTNVFVAPLVLAAICCAFRGEIRGFWSRCGRASRVFICTALVLSGGFALWSLGPWLEVACARLGHPRDVWEFFVSYLRLFSGTSVYSFIPGSIDASRIGGLDVATWGVAAVALYGFYRLLREQRSPLDLALALGWFGSALAFFLFAGPAAIQPHFERYGVCLIAPGAIVLSRGACWYCGGEMFSRRVAQFGMAALAWLLLAGFYTNYFLFTERTGGESHDAFRTAAIEPKLRALAIVLRDREPEEIVSVHTDEWWNFWPLAYLASDLRNVAVVRQGEHSPPGSISNLNFGAPECSWFIEFSASEADRATARRLAESGVPFKREEILDYGGRPVLTIYGPIRKGLRNN